MPLTIDLQQYFTAAKVAKAIEVAPPVHTTVMDTFFPESARIQFDMPLIPLSEITALVDCVPVVSRSGEAVPITGDALSTQYIEPLPVAVRSAVRAQEVNNLRLAGMGQREEWAQRKMLQGRTSVKKTIEALCSQAVFDGAINYPLQMDNGQFARYVVNYGSSIQELTVESGDKWDHNDTTLAKVFLQLEAMSELIDESGYGGEKEVWCGKAAYAQLLVLVETNNAAKQAKVPSKLNNDGSILVGSHLCRKMGEVWRDPETGATHKKVTDREVRMVSRGNHVFFYAALDDLKAGLKAMPMFVNVTEINEPSELRIVCKTKPLPGVAPQATCKAVVMA